MKIVYDGPSLPMLEVGKGIFRVQLLTGGQWRSLETEEEYQLFLSHVVGGITKCPNTQQ